MPDHTELEGWTIPYVEMTLPSGAAKGTIRLPITAYATDAAHLAGNPVPFDTVWTEINGAEFWSQDTNAAGLGSVSYTGAAILDTTKYPDGYYEVITRARSKSGSQGYNNGSPNYQYNSMQRLLIVNAPANIIAPTFPSVTVSTGNPPQVTQPKPNDTYFVRRNINYTWQWSVQSHNPLYSMQILQRDSSGVFQPWRSYSAAFPSSKTTAANGDTVYSFGDAQTLYDYWSVDKNGQNVFRYVATDVYGNAAQFQYAWSLIVSPPATPAPATAVPSISSFAVSPPDRFERLGLPAAMERDGGDRP